MAILEFYAARRDNHWAYWVESEFFTRQEKATSLGRVRASRLARYEQGRVIENESPTPDLRKAQRPVKALGVKD